MIRNRAGAHVNWQLTLRIGFILVLVPAVAALALGMVRFGLARAATVFALFDRATLGVNVVKLAIYGDCLAIVRPRQARWAKVPVWLQPLTRWPLMQDWQAYFSPSMIGMPLKNYGRWRSWDQAVDSRAMWSDRAPQLEPHKRR